MASDIKPIFLLADSQLLFWRGEDGRRFLDRARECIEAGGSQAPPRAAYLGASNGDAPEFYDLFLAAMAEIGLRDCRHIPALPTPEDFDFLAAADLVLLAGGDVQRGWRAFQESGLKEKVAERYYAGAVLVGVSAGSVQLGLKGWDESGANLFDCFGLVPFVVDVHDEPSWSRLLSAVSRVGELTRGVGIPAGGGALYHPDYSLEPIRQPANEVSLGEDGPRQALLMPGGAGEPAAAEDSSRIVSQEELVARVLQDLGDPEPDDEIN